MTFFTRPSAMRILLVVALGFASRALPAQTPAEQAQIARALERGQLMFGLDRAAWVATDDLLRRIPDPAAAGIRGFFVEPQRSGFDVIFYAAAGDTLVQAYRASVTSRGVASHEIFPVASRPPLTAPQRRMVAAVQAAAGTGRRPCAQRFNPLVIPPAGTEAPIDVYLMTPQTEQGIPFGGHFRVTVAPDGSVVSSRAFTNSCLIIPADSRTAAGLVVTHLLDPVPTEIHVFSSMATGVPVYVGTNDPDRRWEVTGERIRLVPAR